MKYLSEYYSQTLSLVQPKCNKRLYELRSNSEVLCTMTFPNFFSENAFVEYDGKVLQIKHEKFWKCDLLIYEKDNSVPLAKAIIKLFNKSFIQLPHGEVLFLKFGIFKNVNFILTELELPVVTIKKNCSFKENNTVTIEHSAKQLKEYPWLIMLLFYVNLSRQRQVSIGF